MLRRADGVGRGAAPTWSSCAPRRGLPTSSRRPSTTPGSTGVLGTIAGDDTMHGASTAGAERSAEVVSRLLSCTAEGPRRDRPDRTQHGPVGRAVRRRPGRRARRPVEVDPLRLAAGPARHRRLAGARPGAARGRAARRRRAGRDARRAGAARADVASGAFAPGRPTRTCTRPLERGLIERAGADVGGRLRAGRSRNDQVATCFRLYLREQRAGVGRASCSTSSTRCVDQADAPPASPCPATPTCSTPSRCCSPTTCSPTGGRCCATSTGCATGTPRRRVAARLRRAGRLVAAARPRGRRRRPRLRRRRSRTRSTATADRDFVAEFAFVAALIGVDLSRLGRGDGAVGDARSSASSRSTTPTPPGRSIMPQKKNPDIAELARGKAGRLVGDLDRPAGHAQGPAARLQPRPAGGQGAGLRRRRHASRCCCPAFSRDGRDAARSTPTGWQRSPPQGFSLATDVAEWLVREGVPFRVAHEVAGALRARVRGARHRAAGTSPTTTSPRSPRTSPRRARGADGRGLARLAPAKGGRRRPVSVSSSTACGDGIRPPGLVDGPPVVR